MTRSKTEQFRVNESRSVRLNFSAVENSSGAVWKQMPFKICSLHKIIISSNSFYISFFFSSPLPFSQQSGARGQEPITHRILLVICCCCCHRVQRSFVWINELLTLKNVHTCRLARLISQWDLYKSTLNDFFASYLTQIDFWKSITASHILAGARHVAQRATEARSANLASSQSLGLRDIECVTSKL